MFKSFDKSIRFVAVNNPKADAKNFIGVKNLIFAHDSIIIMISNM